MSAKKRTQYRVKVQSFVVVPAGSAGAAKAKAEVSLRKAVRESFLTDSGMLPLWGDEWNDVRTMRETISELNDIVVEWAR